MVSEPNKSLLLPWILLLGVVAYGLGISAFTYGWTPGPNYRNVTVDTKVNITGSAPFIIQVMQANPVVLSAGSLSVITCNVSVRDYNGFADISAVNATLFHQTSTLTAADENNTHYTNTSCASIGGQASGINANYTCSFAVNYYALNGTWNCSSFVNDTVNLRGNGSNVTNFSAVYALNISRTLIDYGNLSQGEYSDNISVNISNIGNLNINVSVSGYARNPGDGYAFVCDQGNFTVGTQHFSSNETANYADKQILATAYNQIGNLTVNKSTNANVSLNTTYWEFYADPAQTAFGNCTGFVVFQAEAAV